MKQSKRYPSVKVFFGFALCPSLVGIFLVGIQFLIHVIDQ